MTPDAAARTLLAEALQLSLAELPEQPRLAETPQWDSLAHTRLVLALEDRLGRALTPSEVVQLASLADVLALLQPAPVR